MPFWVFTRDIRQEACSNPESKQPGAIEYLDRITKSHIVMKHPINRFALVLLICMLTGLTGLLRAQGTLADYRRADTLAQHFEGKALHVIDELAWIDDSHRFWYRKTVEGGHVFMLVDADSQSRERAFDHERIADTISGRLDDSFTALELPFEEISFVNGGQALEFEAGDSLYTCALENYACTAEEAPPPPWAQDDDEEGDDEVVVSPDGEWEAFVHNYNVAIRRADGGERIMLSSDGSEGNYYDMDSFSWSPDSEKLAAYRVIPGFNRQIHYIQSAPEDRLQPRHTTSQYTKPGDVLEKEMPVLFHIEEREQVIIDNSLFPNAYSQSDLEWWSDSRAFHFEYNARGHEDYKVIEVDAESGIPRALIHEKGNPFVSYSTTNWRYDTENGEEIIWASERDNWRHLYLYDGRTGEVKNQITSGEWVVREIDSVDTEKRQIWFRASGMDNDQDPYFLHAYRINFDGSGLTRLTGANGTHTVSYSDDMAYYVDRWSRVDAAPQAVLRRTSDQSVVMELEEADLQPLRDAGWQAPEPFTAKGRDGETDIWGVIVRPTDFDPSENYPVIEYIYAGPHDSFVPKDFDAYSHMMSLAELGFVVVQIDGMGTDNRSKEFHNVAWKNLKDAGFPDRIRWHKAAAEQYDWYDISKVGIYGTSAGGQSSMGALLFHPEFYKVAVSASGCHDNRMDKIWWNEQWMGWPVGPQYAASSNVEHAHRLQGNLMLIVGNQDTNVPPTSTYQVADALVDAGKNFDFFVVPNGGHTSGGELGERMRRDFFVEHILDAEPPHWNSMEETNSR